MNSEQQTSFENWIKQHYPKQLFSLQPLLASAGKRQYFRVNFSNQTRILMYVPPDAEVTLPNVIAVTQAFEKCGIRVPKLFFHNLEIGLLILEDFGEGVYDHVLNAENVERLYQQALSALLKIQTCQSIPKYGMPDFIDDFFTLDMNLWQEWFVQQYWNTSLPTVLRDHLLELLQKNAEEQPRVCMHRDYHSRNLIQLPDGTTGVLDFQSAMWGPFSYDAVSLLRDCYITWPAEQVKSWADNFLKQASEQAGIPYSQAQQWQWFELMGLQRHLKALGTFARKYSRDGETAYLADIKRTIPYILDVTKRYSELKEFHEWFKEQNDH
jgi:aminoglycoside/choline kinase family phosphotransferase